VSSIKHPIEVEVLVTFHKSNVLVGDIAYNLVACSSVIVTESWPV